MIYVVAFILILYSWILVDLKHYRKLSSVCICVIIVFLILIAGLRYRVGGDSFTLYEYIYFNAYMEKLGILLVLMKDMVHYGIYFCAISKTLGADFVYLQLLHAIIVNLTFLYVFRSEV